MLNFKEKKVKFSLKRNKPKGLEDIEQFHTY